MKIFQVPFCFYPDPVGGTEVYVEALATQLKLQGHEVHIVAPSLRNQTYTVQGLLTHRFALEAVPADLNSLYGDGDRIAAQNFAALLDQEKPDLVHLHAFTAGVSIRLVRAAHQRRIPVLFTYHTPTVSCQRGTLLKQGTQICSGQLEVKNCTRCTLQGLGLGNISSHFIGSLPTAMGKSLSAIGFHGGAWTALRMSQLVACQHQAFQSLMLESDHIIAVCDWVKDVLTCNQVPAQKVTVLRQGLCHPESKSSHLNTNYSKVSPRKLRLAFLGRFDPVKGIHILVQALKQLPNQQNITLDIYGITQSVQPNAYQEELLAYVERDSRITVKLPIPASQVVPTLSRYDALAVPSQWLETGPLVVLEAFAAGTPVIGSRLGGISELVVDGRNGILVEPDSVQDWAEKIDKLCSDRTQLEVLKSGILPPKSMTHVAKCMMPIYQRVTSHTATRREQVSNL